MDGERARWTQFERSCARPRGVTMHCGLGGEMTAGQSELMVEGGGRGGGLPLI